MMDKPPPDPARIAEMRRWGVKVTAAGKDGLRLAKMCSKLGRPKEKS